MRKVLMTRLCSCPADRFLSKRNRRSGWRVAGFRDQGFYDCYSMEFQYLRPYNPNDDVTACRLLQVLNFGIYGLNCRVKRCQNETD